MCRIFYTYVRNFMWPWSIAGEHTPLCTYRCTYTPKLSVCKGQRHSHTGNHYISRKHARISILCACVLTYVSLFVGANTVCIHRSVHIMTWMKYIVIYVHDVYILYTMCMCILYMMYMCYLYVTCMYILYVTCMCYLYVTCMCYLYMTYMYILYVMCMYVCTS